MSATVAPDHILKELADLWVSLGKEGQSEGGAGVLRACSMTLVVLAEESDDVMALGETIAALMPEHPARAIVVRLRGAGERALTERVYSQCWMPFGQRRQICCEQIELTASDASLADLPSVVLPLAVPDLPLILWCRTPRLLGMPEFHQIAAMARKVVVDSAKVPDPELALGRMAELSRLGVLLGDLSWTKLTRWREMLSQVFENQQYLGQLARISSVRVSFGEDHEVAARFMAVWIANALADVGVRAETAVKPEDAAGGGSPSRPAIARSRVPVTLRVSLAGGGLSVELVREADRLVITVNGFSHCTNLPQPSDYLLMREELGIVRHDAVFERTLASAARLAYPTD
ncbi:MAG: glucose-6-phosphate dehydrogenase assembly protein OpcA [Acidobacteriia bacterium]|nr:glucose-6-phosphate dehydrogenase assembly protein OpcA [Terriglobia bacterium]